MSVCSGSVYCKSQLRDHVEGVTNRDSPNLDRMLNMPSWSARRSDADLKDTGDKTPGVTGDPVR